MGSFEGKRGLIFGVANKNSIAWGIAQALAEEGAELGFSYAGEVLQKRVTPLAESVGSKFIEECDVTNDAAIDGLFEKAEKPFWQSRLSGALDCICTAGGFGRPFCGYKPGGLSPCS